MRLPNRLYLRIYLAMLASLLIAALIMGLVWRHTFEGGFLRGQFAQLAADIAAELLPAQQADPHALQRALEQWARRSHASLALYDASRRLVASAGPHAPALPAAQTETGWLPAKRGPPAIALRLADGRWLVARHEPRAPRQPMGFVFALVLIALVMAALAYPLARRLTRRLERLQRSVEQLGTGDLAARAPVQGNDEVAALARSFNRSAERIEALMRSQKDLLANASHELRSPLARLRMTAEQLQDKADPAQRAHLRQDIQELDQLIDEILLASRLESGATPVVRDTVDLTALAAEECARAEAEFDGQPVTLQGDAVLLRRLLRNLLENARRHGGGTPVQANLTRGAHQIRVQICDRGPGVPEAEREKVFEPFYRRAGLAEGGGGAGLGLSLVRQIARAHQGEVTCLPRAGGGSCFEFRLPLDPT